MTKKTVFLAILGVLILAGIIWAINYLALFQRPAEISSLVNVEKNDEAPPTNAEDRDDETVDYTVEEVVSDLFVPWSIVFTSNARMLVSERSGSIRIISNKRPESQPLHTFAEVSHEGEEGLMGLALDPDYDKNKTVYACLAYGRGENLRDKVVSFKDNGDSAGDIKTVIDGIPAATNHAGCRLMFLPDNTLLITTGDATDRNLAQDPVSLAGKILRVNRDGSVPEDNPFPGSPIYTLGHRNPQGLSYDHEHGIIWSSEHGPSVFDGPAGGDEINIIEKGNNYGWPIIHHKQKKSGLVSPLLEYTPAVAPGSILYYSADALPQFKGNIFFGGLRGEGIWRLTLAEDDPRRVLSFEKMKDISVGRIRDLVAGPDGAIYFTTSNRDGRGSVRDNDDKIYRIAPKG